MSVCACICKCVCIYNIYIYMYWKNKTPSRRACPALKKRYEKRVGPFFEKVTRKAKERSWCTLSCSRDARERFQELFFAFYCRVATIRLRRSRQKILIRASFSQGDSSKEFSSIYGIT